jgi:hypothetical protein
MRLLRSRSRERHCFGSLHRSNFLLPFPVGNCGKKYKVPGQLLNTFQIIRSWPRPNHETFSSCPNQKHAFECLSTSVRVLCNPGLFLLPRRPDILSFFMTTHPNAVSSISIRRSPPFPISGVSICDLRSLHLARELQTAVFENGQGRWKVADSKFSQTVGKGI